MRLLKLSLLFCFIGSLIWANSGSGFLDLGELQRAAAGVTLEVYPDADDVLVDDYVLTTYEKDGTAITWDDWGSKILTEKGKQNNRVMTLQYNASYSKAEFVLVQIIKADGSILKVDLARQSQEMIDRSQMGSNIYDPNNKIIQVSLAELEIGDLLRALTRRTIVKPRVPDSFSDFQTFEYSSPILRYVVEINAPAELPLRNIVLKDEVPGTVTSSEPKNEKGRILYRWEAKNVPQAFPEAAMPPLYTVTQRLLVSTLESWQDISRWYWKISEPHFAATSDMKIKVNELIQGKAGTEEKIRAIFRFVSQEIRYMGVTLETEAPGYEPHDVSITFANRHGVCRDKAALLTVMLRLAGFEAFPVLIHAGAKKDPEVPQPFFNHAIVAVLNPDKSYQLMDPTDENTRDLLPAYLCNRSYLVARPEGDVLRTSDIIPYDRNLSKIKTSGKISEEGDLTCVSQVVMEGINDNAYRGMLLRRTPDQRQEFFEAVLKGIIPGARLVRFDILPADLQDTSLPLEFHLSFTAPQVMIRNEQSAMLKIPRLSAGLGYVNFILGEAGLEKRRFPFETSLTCGVIEEVKMELAAEWNKVLSMPEFTTIDNPGMHWSRQLQFLAGTLSLNSEFSIRTVEFSPAEYQTLKAALRSIEADGRKQPIFGHQKNPADDGSSVAQKAAAAATAESHILLDQRSFKLADANNWTMVQKIRKKILTYKGMKDNSELKWDFNPAWQEVKLDYAIVRNGDQEQKISAAEINLMDAPWVASAPRYPAGKTLVASLPGVQVGSIIEYQVTQSVRANPFFHLMLAFQSHDPIEKRELSIDCPADLKLGWKVFQNGCLNFKTRTSGEVIQYQKKTLDDREIHSWFSEKQVALTREKNLPPAYAFLPTVIVWSGDWKQYCQQIVRSLEFASQNGREVMKLVEAIRAMRPERQLLSLRNHIERAVRIAGPHYTELPRYCLSPAEKTYSEGYGHSADRAALYYSILQELGYQPELILVADEPQEENLQKFWKKYPSGYFFPEMLVRVRTKQGDVWFNDQDQYARLGSSRFHGRLACSPARNRFFRIELPTEAQNLVSKLITIDMQPDGAAQIAFRNLYQGEHYAQLNKFYSEQTPEERRRHYQSMLAELSQSASSIVDLKTEFEIYPGSVRYTALVEDFAVTTDNYCHFEFPETLARLLQLWGDQREEALYWGNRSTRQVEIAIRLPSDFRIIELCPEDFEWTSPEKNGRVSIKRLKTQSQNELRYLLEADLGAEIIPAEKYPDILELDRRLSHPAARTVLLRKK
ncbi:MAG: DUF3857 domain-containing protein [Lentisphaeria bacterium]|nr:DUF3857 domain-containing protein [Lentisphaeria bacterium]